MDFQNPNSMLTWCINWRRVLALILFQRSSPNFLNKAICIRNFAKPFLNFINDTMIWYLNSKLNLNLSYAMDFRNLHSMLTWCINWRRLLSLILFQRSSPNFLNKAIGIRNFAKPFLNFIDDIMIWYLNSKLNLNLSYAMDFRNLHSMLTWCINWRRLLSLILFQRSSLK